jgi:hypothetical protein
MMEELVTHNFLQKSFIICVLTLAKEYVIY